MEHGTSAICKNIIDITRERNKFTMAVFYSAAGVAMMLFIVPSTLASLIINPGNFYRIIKKAIAMARLASASLFGVIVSMFDPISVGVAVISCVNDIMACKGIKLYIEDNVPYSEEAVRKVLLKQ